MEATRSWIQQVRSDNQRIIHQTNELVTVVNHTFAELRLNREHIRDIEAYISKLHDRITRWTAISTIAFERVRASLRIYQCLPVLECVCLFYIRQLSRYQRQRAALESGILTEDILPPMLPAMLSKFRYIQTLHTIPSVWLCFIAKGSRVYQGRLNMSTRNHY